MKSERRWKSGIASGVEFRRVGSRAQRGQSLIVAVIVMFVLLFVGGLFVALVARNLLNTGRARDTIAAQSLADAGIRFADSFLQYSPEGADWRPSPATAPPDPSDPEYVKKLRVYNADPDRRWLDQGYSRIPLSGGRALVKVDMAPDPRDPLGKYISIRAIGRVGVLTEDDPTTYVDPSTGAAPRLRREQLAYKAIGITDYLRFVTNLTNDSKFEATLGLPPIGIPATVQYGGLPVRFPGGAPSWFTGTGAPIMVNGKLRLLDYLQLEEDPRLHDTVRVAGDIVVDNVDRTSANRPLLRNISTGQSSIIYGTNETDNSGNNLFTTGGGLLADSSSSPDGQGYTRNISRLNPPLIDQADPATGITRYRMSTRDAGMWLTRQNGTSFNTGRFGLGGGLYVDNTNNYERESQGVSGGQSLRSIWMQPGSTTNWNGPYYIPPGVYVEFGYPVAQDRDSNGNLQTGQFSAHPGFRVIRDAASRTWRDPNGVVGTREQAFTFFIYKPAGQKPVLKLENEFFRSFLRRDQGLSEQDIDRLTPAFNGVIFAEGNVRVRGLVPSVDNMQVRREAGDNDGLSDVQIRQRVNPPAITLVSAACIYVEGSLVRERPDSMIALLAEKSVVVNTTMFVSPNKGMAWVGSNQDELPPYHTNISLDEPARTPPFSLDYINGENVASYNTPVFLLIRHGTAPGASYLNLLINEALPPTGRDPLYAFNANTAPYSLDKPWPTVYPLTNLLGGADLFEQRGLPLYGDNTLPATNPPSPFDTVRYNYFTGVGERNTIRPQVDPNFLTAQGVQDYLFGRAAIAPMDVRIEAVMYAQTGSFFVIPGYPLNTNPADTRDAAVRRGQALGYTDGRLVRPTGTLDVYPFYGEPYDCRITIVGAVAENQTAAPADQAAWMSLWGYIPDHHGSSTLGVPQAHACVSEVGGSTTDQRTNAERTFYSNQNLGQGGITRGIRFLYDPALVAPYSGYVPAAPVWATDPRYLRNPNSSWAYTQGGTFRQDEYGRYLPPLPRLPVCPGFVFVGDELPPGL